MFVTVAPLAPRGCVSIVVRLANCTFLAKRPVSDAFTSLAVSPDGRWLYAGGASTFAFRVG